MANDGDGERSGEANGMWGIWWWYNEVVVERVSCVGVAFRVV